jgi:antitoxin PrlF
MQLHYHRIHSHLEPPMPALIAAESTLTDRYQTTVPDAVRKALKLGKRDKLRYTVQPDGNVLLSRADDADTDPALTAFLNFLANDMTQHPGHLQGLDPTLVQRMQALTAGVTVDMDAPLSADGE